MANVTININRQLFGTISSMDTKKECVKWEKTLKEDPREKSICKFMKSFVFKR